jgi:hypothetical protein
VKAVFPLVLFLCAATAGAQDVVPAVHEPAGARLVEMPRRAWHWAGRHKEEIILDSAVFGSRIVDATSTRYALDHGATEGNPILGPHPSNAALFGFSLGIASLVAFCNHHMLGWDTDAGKNWAEFDTMVFSAFGGIQAGLNYSGGPQCTTNPAIVPGPRCQPATPALRPRP